MRLDGQVHDEVKHGVDAMAATSGEANMPQVGFGRGHTEVVGHHSGVCSALYLQERVLSLSSSVNLYYGCSALK